MSENQHTAKWLRLQVQNERRRADRLAEEVKVLRLHLHANGIEPAMVQTHDAPKASDGADRVRQLREVLA